MSSFSRSAPSSYGTTVGAIQRANQLGGSTLIRAGQRLHIPGDAVFLGCQDPVFNTGGS